MPAFSRLKLIPLLFLFSLTVTGCQTSAKWMPVFSRSEVSSPAIYTAEESLESQSSILKPTLLSVEEDIVGGETLEQASADMPEYPETQTIDSIPEPFYRQVKKMRKDDGLVRVGMLVPLSGAAEKVGLSLKNAALMSQFDLADDQFVLQFYDTKSTVQGAQEAAIQAVSHGVELIIGPLFSQHVSVVAPIVRSMGLNAIVFTTDPAVIGRGVFSIGLLLEQQVDRILSYAYMKGYGRFAVLVPETVGGQAVAGAAERAVKRLNADFVRVAYYDPDAKDFSNVVRDLSRYDERKRALESEKEKLEIAPDEDEIAKETLKRFEQMDTIGEVDFDAILIHDEGSRLRSVSSLLSYYDVSSKQVKFLGTSLWADESLSKEEALIGGWYATPPPQTHKNFIKRYKELYTDAPPRIASLGYDAVALAVTLAGQKGNADYSLSALTDPNGFEGIDGIFRFLNNGRSERALSVMEITKEGSKEISPSRRSFEPVFNAPYIDVNPGRSNSYFLR